MVRVQMGILNSGDVVQREKISQQRRKRIQMWRQPFFCVCVKWPRGELVLVTSMTDGVFHFSHSQNCSGREKKSPAFHHARAHHTMDRMNDKCTYFSAQFITR